MRHIELSLDTRSRLQRICNAHPKPYMRERAGAILKIADGMPPARVAREGLLQRRDADTVYGWLNRFGAEGIAGLAIRPGRGRKPAWGNKEPEQAKEELLDTVRRDPHVCGYPRSRWRLEDILQECAELLPELSSSGLWRILDRLHISYKRGRDHVHSPDPDYQAKRDYLADILAQVRASEDRLVFVYMDELTYYRQPTLARAYEERGECQPLAERSHCSNTPTRVAGALNALTGQVDYWQGSAFRIPQIVGFYKRLCRRYASAVRIFMGQDNWPMHFHPDVLVALQPQEHPFPMRVPGHWSPEPSEDALRKWGDLRLPIQLVPLPTYASWLNPIEKLWRWLKQDFLHLHRLADCLDRLRQFVRGFLEEFEHGSPRLLRYVGLPA